MQLETFRARFPWWGPHLQTMRNPLMRRPRLPGGEGERVLLPLADGDRLQARLDRPARPCAARPLVVLVHGLGGCETSNYMLLASRFFTERGAAVLRLSLRGAGPSQATCRDWSHAARFGDLEQIFAQLEAPPAGVIAIGFSLGGCILLNYLSRGRVDPRLRAAASVCAPLDLMDAAGVLHDRRNRLYHDYLLRALKADYLNPHASLSPTRRTLVAEARTLWEVDDRVTAPLHGFGRAEVYYRVASPLAHVSAITCPTLLVHAVDDPFVPVGPYSRVDGPGVEVAMASGGGHLGFHDREGLWHLRRIEAFLAIRAGAVPAEGLSADERACSSTPRQTRIRA